MNKRTSQTVPNGTVVDRPPGALVRLQAVPALARQEDALLDELEADLETTKLHHTLVNTALIFGGPVATALVIMSLVPTLPVFALGIGASVSVAGVGIVVNLLEGRRAKLDLKQRVIASQKAHLRRQLRPSDHEENSEPEPESTTE